MDHSPSGFRVGDYVSDGKKIGKGSFATVYLGHHANNPKNLVAIKVVDVDRLSRNNEKLKRHLESEISIMKSIQHEHIVRQLDVVMDPQGEYIYVVLEFCEGGDFSKFLKKHKRLPEEQARYFLGQLADGLKHLHERSIIHRDLKPQNLLLQRRSGTTGQNYTDWVLKIADFGFARIIDAESVASTLCGSPLYMAPEVLLCQPYDAKADLWSVGAILFEMLVGNPPYNVRTQIELVRILLTSKIHFPRNLNISDECFSLLQNLLKKNQGERISWEGFFSHPFVVSRDSLSYRTLKPSNLSTPAGSSTSSTSSTTPSATAPLLIPLLKKSRECGNDSTPPPTSGIMLSPSPSMSISPSSSFGSPHLVSTIRRIPSGMVLATTPPTAPRQPVAPTTSAASSSLIRHSSSAPASSSSTSSEGTLSRYGRSSHEIKDSTAGSTTSSTSASGHKSAHQSLEKGWGWLPPRRPHINPFKEDSLDSLRTASPSNSLHIDIPAGESSSSSDGSFEMINSVSSSADQYSLEEKQVLDDIERHYSFANVVAEVAEFKVGAQSPVEALSLYVKALHIYQDILAHTKRIVQTQGLSDSSRLSLVLEKMREDFTSCLSKAEYWKRNLRPTDAACAEKSIYEVALAMGKEGAVAEVTKNFDRAQHMYRRASLLLQLLHNEAHHPADRTVLESYMTSFAKRLMTAAKKQNELEQEQRAAAVAARLAPSSLPY
jgi:serine/threonine-protein kinase ULK/ATG1